MLAEEAPLTPECTHTRYLDALSLESRLVPRARARARACGRSLEAWDP